MPDPRILVCGPALNGAESASRLAMLRGVSLPNATKFLVTTGKFDAQTDARTFNIEAQYPAETAYLQTLARWAEVPDWPDARFRDGYDLFCLQRVLTANPGFDIAVLLREATDFETRWPALVRDLNGQLYLTLETIDSSAANSGPSLLINMTDQRAKVFLDLASQIYLAGASYAIEPYSLDRALDLAVESLSLESSLKYALGEACSAVRTGASVDRGADLAENDRPVCG